MRVSVTLPLILLLTVPILAKDDASNRLEAATMDLKAMVEAGDSGVPRRLLAKAACVVVIPSLKAGGFIVGAEYGKGFFTCRKQGGLGWSAPGSVRMAGGKFGLLVGAKATDIVMLVMDERGIRGLLSDHFQIGGELSGAAGPVGRDTTAETDAQLKAEILTYSRSHGLFGGIDLDGASLSEDKKSNLSLYGTELSNKEVLEKSPKLPVAATPFVHALDRLSPASKSKHTR